MNNDVKFADGTGKEIHMHNVLSHLEYASYKSNRDAGMTHEQLISIGVGDGVMKHKYENEKQGDGKTNK